MGHTIANDTEEIDDIHPQDDSDNETQETYKPDSLPETEKKSKVHIEVQPKDGEIQEEHDLWKSEDI